MSNAIATVSVESFKIARTSKSGKVSERGLLGLIIEGTTSERAEAGLVLAKEAWDNGKLRVTLDELARVFAGRSWDVSVAFCKLDTANPNKDTMVALMDALTRFHSDAKGVKAKYVALCTELVAWSKGEAARKEARRIAFEAALVAAAAIETK